MSYVPRPPSFIGKEARDGFYALLGEIREAETNVELTFYMERYIAASREARSMFTMIEAEILSKMRDFRLQYDRETAEQADDVRHIDRGHVDQERSGNEP